MRLNYDLLREILLKIEDVSDGHTCYMVDEEFSEEFFPNYKSDVVFFHVSYLRQRGFINPVLDESCVISLTPAGYDYLDAVRNDGVWKDVKQTLSTCIKPTLPIVKALAIEIAKKQLGF